MLKANELIEKTRSLLRSRKRSYELTFQAEGADDVLKDLVVFCRGTGTTFHEDPRIHALLEGRREVLMRIAQHLKLSFEDLWALHDGRNIVDPKEEDKND